MEVSKFIIDDNDVYVKDAEARSEIYLHSESLSEIQSEIDSQSVAYSEMFSEVDDDISAKQDVSSAWKIGQTSVTVENVSIDSLANYNFRAPIPAEVSNVIVLNARSYDTSRTLVPINLYTSGGYMNALMSNQRTSAFTNETMTIQFTYAYK